MRMSNAKAFVPPALAVSNCLRREAHAAVMYRQLPLAVYLQNVRIFQVAVTPAWRDRREVAHVQQ